MINSTDSEKECKNLKESGDNSNECKISKTAREIPNRNYK